MAMMMRMQMTAMMITLVVAFLGAALVSAQRVTVTGEPCVFPTIYRGQTLNDCTPVGGVDMCKTATGMWDDCLSEDAGEVRMDSPVKSPPRNGVVVTVDRTSVNSGDIVKVTVENDSPGPNDWVGAYSPGSGVDVSAISPVKYAVLRGEGPRDVARFWDGFDEGRFNRDYLQTGKASLFFKLVSVRASDYVFKVFQYDVTQVWGAEWESGRTGMNSTWELNESPKVVIEDADMPSKVRVLPARMTDPADKRTMRFMWSSGDSERAAPVMLWSYSSRPSSGVLELVGEISKVPAMTVTYGREDMCGPPATTCGYRDAGPVHEALVGGLDWGREVYYQVGSSLTGSMSKVYTFKMPPPPGAPARLAVWGDMGNAKYGDAYSWYAGMPGARETMKEIDEYVERREVDFAFCNGDISYGMGRAALWDDYLLQMEKLISYVPFVQTHGNHEMDVPFWHDWDKDGVPPGIYDGNSSGGECGVPSLRLLHGPWERDARGTEVPIWSQDVGNIHLVGIATEMDYAPGSMQYEFLEEDLRKVDRSVTPWIVVGGHRPGLIDSGYEAGCTENCAYTDSVMTLTLFLEPLFVKYGVDVVLWAHSHDYQRQCATMKFECQQRSHFVDRPFNAFVQYNPPAPIHFSVGSAGAGYTPYNHFNTAFTERDSHVFGFSMITAHNASHLHFEMINANGTDHDGEVFDDLWIVNSDDEMRRSRQLQWGARYAAIDDVAVDVETVPDGMKRYADYFTYVAPGSAAGLDGVSSWAPGDEDGSGGISAGWMVMGVLLGIVAGGAVVFIFQKLGQRRGRVGKMVVDDVDRSHSELSYTTHTASAPEF